VLHCFQGLEELSLHNVQVSHSHHNVNLPLFHTLKRLTILGGCVKWLDGHKFLQLTSFNAWPGPEWHTSFSQRVDMPVCTYIQFSGWDVECLRIFQAGIVAPLLYEWDMQYLTLQEEFFQGAKDSKKSVGLWPLEHVHPQVLRVAIGEYYQGLIMIITPRHELEELSIKFYGSCMAANGVLSALMETTDIPLSTETPNGYATTTGICDERVTRVICPNLKSLGLRFRYVSRPNREKVRQWCVQMMEGRKQTGNPLGRCCIWWAGEGDKDSLITSNEGMIEDIENV